MIDHEKVVATALDLKTKNLAFFEEFYPGIFSYFKQYQLKKSKLDIQPERNELDLIENGKHLYGGARNYAKREIAQFLSHFDYGKSIRSINPLYEGDYKNPRFFARHIERIYRNSSLQPSTFTGYEIPGLFPLTVFMGCGLGLHIDMLVKVRDLKHVLLTETNMDHFYASFYSVDWGNIVKPFLLSEDRSFDFILIPNITDEQKIRDVVWNKLIDFCPFFPVMTFFYNHLGVGYFDRVIDSINADLYVHLFSFGNYDDEINQLNNALHNFKQGLKRLPLPTEEGFDLPVCIVGSGPSLDERIDWLKSIQKGSIIVSCGTALRALYHHGVKPDFHIELESDYNSFTTQSLNEDKEYLRSIRLIGAAQLTPKMYTLFDEKRIFFKGEGVLKDLFALEGEAIKDSAPTCTNAGLAFAFHFKFKNILLFGLDFGFPNKLNHHAQGSLYYQKNAPEGLVASAMNEDSDLISLPAAGGGTIKSTTFLYSAKRRVENIIQGLSRGNIYNCSKGCLIQNTIWLDEFESTRFCASEEIKKDAVSYLFADSALQVEGKEIEEKISKLKLTLKELTKFIQARLSLDDNSDEDIINLFYSINHHLQTKIKNENEALYYFIRGSVWHFLHAGFSHIFALKEGIDRRSFKENWLRLFRSFIDGLETHFNSILEKDFNIEEDPLTRRSISQTESESTYAYLADLDWTYTGVILQENGEYVSEPLH